MPTKILHLVQQARRPELTSLPLVSQRQKLKTVETSVRKISTAFSKLTLQDQKEAGQCPALFIHWSSKKYLGYRE